MRRLVETGRSLKGARDIAYPIFLILGKLSRKEGANEPKTKSENSFSKLSETFFPEIYRELEVLLLAEDPQNPKVAI